ncbi:MAG: exosortase C-terminal domain/associated protein EpsI [Candidatus Solibacter sp.]
MKASSGTTAQLIGTLLLLSLTLAASKVTSDRQPRALRQPLETVETRLGDFVGTDNPPLSDGVLKELKPTSYLERTYRKGDLAADLFIAFYAQQRAGESMHSPKHCLPGSGWEIWDYGTMDIAAAGRKFTVNKYSVSRDAQRRLVIYWYQSHNRVFASEYLGKILLARDALVKNSTAGSIVRIVVPDQPGALQEAAELASSVVVRVGRCFGD